MTIIVTGSFDLDPAKRDDFIAAARECQAASRQDEGCESYTFSADLDEPGRFHVSEQWASQEAMDAHMGQPHMATFMGAMGGFGVTGVTLTKWEGATGSKLM
jgi:quinol monooxygenase YgiN